MGLLNNPVNNPDTVAEVMDRLRAEGLSCLLFGGWAEQALELCRPRPHADIDLLLTTDTFHALDDMLVDNAHGFQEVSLKRFRHKRAFLINELLVELLLVQRLGSTYRTLFWGDVPFVWAQPLPEIGYLAGHRLPMASKENLQRYRSRFRSTEPWRWKDPASRVP